MYTLEKREINYAQQINSEINSVRNRITYRLLLLEEYSTGIIDEETYNSHILNLNKLGNQ